MIKRKKNKILGSEIETRCDGEVGYLFQCELKYPPKMHEKN